MTEKLVKPVIKGLAFALSLSLVIAVVVTLLLYFEVVGVPFAGKVLYGTFILILFVTSFMVARTIGSRGLLVGLGIAGFVIFIGAMYRLVGVESGLNLQFLIRSAITLLVSTFASIAGVNTVN